ncbi:MAG: septum formation initiator family protein [Clostridia bacterium]|nr:septum formation initiator family protein [Clostridia bacterium]
MTDEKGRKNKRRFNFKSWLVVALAVYMISFMYGQQIQINNLNKSIAETEAMTREKQQKSAEIDDAAEMYSSDEFVERVARDSLGFVRSDETVFVDVTGK